MFRGRDQLASGGYGRDGNVRAQQGDDAVLILRRIDLLAGAARETHFDQITRFDVEIGGQKRDRIAAAVGERLGEFHIYPCGPRPVARSALTIDVDTQVLLDEDALDDTRVRAAVQPLGAGVALHQRGDGRQSEDTDEAFHAAGAGIRSGGSGFEPGRSK